MWGSLHVWIGWTNVLSLQTSVGTTAWIPTYLMLKPIAPVSPKPSTFIGALFSCEGITIIPSLCKWRNWLTNRLVCHMCRTAQLLSGRHYQLALKPLGFKPFLPWFFETGSHVASIGSTQLPNSPVSTSASSSEACTTKPRWTASLKDDSSVHLLTSEGIPLGLWHYLLAAQTSDSHPNASSGSCNLPLVRLSPEKRCSVLHTPTPAQERGGGEWTNCYSILLILSLKGKG